MVNCKYESVVITTPGQEEQKLAPSSDKAIKSYEQSGPAVVVVALAKDWLSKKQPTYMKWTSPDWLEIHATFLLGGPTEMSEAELWSAVRGQSLCEIQQCTQRLQEQRGMKEGEQGRRRNRG